tara:strand:+ start:330 stop:623 length:294 start_codon:yes stop_codon:yes gene_type:complete
MQVVLSVLVKIFVVIVIVEKNIEHIKAAKIGMLKLVISGLETISTPKKPKTIAINLDNLNLSFKKIGAIKIIQSGVENSNANICDNGINTIAKSQQF